MPTTIAAGSNTITPHLVTGYESTRESRNLVHNIIGSSAPDTTLKPAALRSGTLTMMFITELASAECEDVHAAGGVFTLTDSDLSTIGMSYVTGTIRRELDPQTRKVWLVHVGYQEVSA